MLFSNLYICKTVSSHLEITCALLEIDTFSNEHNYLKIVLNSTTRVKGAKINVYSMHLKYCRYTVIKDQVSEYKSVYWEWECHRLNKQWLMKTMDHKMDITFSLLQILWRKEERKYITGSYSFIYCIYLQYIHKKKLDVQVCVCVGGGGS